MPAVNEKVTSIKRLGPEGVPTPLTSDQRVQIRNLLDKHFDDSVGYYLDGYSDRRIADEIDVPRVHIEQIREAAYGPLRVNPAVTQMQNDISILRREIEAQQQQLAKLQELAGTMEAALPSLG